MADEAGREDRLAAVARRVAECVDVLERLAGRRPRHIPSTENIDGGYPFYREEGGRLVYRVRERGRDVIEDAAEDVEDLVRRIMAGVVFDLACAHVARHPRPREDSRRQLFALTEEWLTAMDPAWGARERERHTEILRGNPFSD